MILRISNSILAHAWDRDIGNIRIEFRDCRKDSWQNEQEDSRGIVKEGQSDSHGMSQMSKTTVKFVQIHKASTAGQLFEGNIQTLQTWHKPRQVKTSKVFDQPSLNTLYTLYTKTIQLLDMKYGVSQSFQSCIVWRFQQKRVCVCVCKTVTVWWPGQLEKEQFVRHPFHRQRMDCLQLIEKRAKKNVTEPPILPGCNLLVRLQ